MKARTFSTLPALLCSLALTFHTSADEKPNFLIILCDDLGYADVGFNGSEIVDTPVLDQLASNGVIFKNGYVTHPYCGGPSRAGLITGRYQARFEMEINLTYSPFDIQQGLPLDGVNLIPYLNGKKSGPPHRTIFWRTNNGTSWCIRTPEAKFLLENHGATEPELYDMVNDPYESNNIIEERSELRQQLAKLWNEWNTQNQTTYLLQSGAYQKKRQEMKKN